MRQQVCPTPILCGATAVAWAQARRTGVAAAGTHPRPPGRSTTRIDWGLGVCLVTYVRADLFLSTRERNLAAHLAGQGALQRDNRCCSLLACSGLH